ncbi:type ISP restriction/modification enzyme [Nocardioides sp. P86]|uniref:DEAD/DEAH box helicase n=1 Tax=Nocardioides sp. P86 TaxID=2939569 RepID=UPI00203C43DA|nr:type ISP restriction/modification enzyme [Nocardioides sp. P86]MCM3516245.1 DEAD/DEAH box helicase family protein [Nocardioides sp. P86]
MSVTIHEVLGGLRETALDTRDKGDRFERLVLNLLRTEKEWTTRFSEVWLWKDWPGRNGRPDTGIDLVAKHRDRDGYAAIQCKFYDAEHRVSKGDLDTFLAASGGEEFVSRYFFDTADNWNTNAKETAAYQAVPVQRVDLAYLAEARIDWEQYSWETPEVLVSLGPKHLRPHQERALADVRAGLQTHDRGKLIMACGTGKTFTSLRIAEELVGAGGRVLFLVPSIQLLSQSLREWMQEATVDIRPFAVCSDVRVGRKVSDDGDISVIDLTEPATTDADKLVQRVSTGRHATPRMDVVFSTYQSIDVIAEAQKNGLADFDLIICDEAHRTTGVTLADVDESAFVKVHDNNVLRAAKRLYMTATPRVFGEEAKRKAVDADAVLADMNDETIYGPELHRLGFGDAVEADLLTDYKVLVLAVDQSYVAENFQQAMASTGEIALDDAAKLIGSWNGLAKNFGSTAAGSDDTAGVDRAPMKRAVAFAKDIRSSKQAAASFPALVDRAIDGNTDPARSTTPRVEAEHVDGTMGVQERNKHLAWLSEEPPEGVCRILTNARCLSEGVDVPALDAVMFLTPRGSQVDVVQSVGRVMRKAPGKQLGYIILPVVIPAGVAPEDALRDNERYKVVWQVLQALRSHDDRFNAMINQIELNKGRTDRLIIDLVTPPPEPGQVIGGDHPADDPDEIARQRTEQLMLSFDIDAYRDAMHARIVAKVGERRYWETWAKDVADIAAAHTVRIKGLISNPESNPAKEFEAFLDGLRANLNESITADEAIDMLAQHLITRPIFEALFAGYEFTKHNPVAQTMELMLASLDEHNLEAEQQSLDKFYDSVRRRVEGVRDAEGKQRVIVELYDKFFSTAFPKTVDRLGIVYTPIEIVDFILNSADHVLREEFGQGLTDEGVHILDGFTGTGTFVVRLLQSGLIEPHDLARKYAGELHANEILLLAYYIAAVNIETTYAAIANGDGQAAGTYEPFPGLVLTDTFQSYEDGDRDDLGIFPGNNERIERQRQLPITVIVGNPPYSVGQDSANDDNQNAKYPTIDTAIRDTYAARSSARSTRTMYDSYIRAIKWASLRIKDRGVIAFVTNGGFLEANTADGMRKTLTDEFTSIHVLNLRGNQRTAGEDSRKEGGKVFGSGSRATVAITVLVKNPDSAGPSEVKYTDIGDYLSRENKLAKVAEARSFQGLDRITLQANQHGDWLSRRDARFDAYVPLGDKSSPVDGVFRIYSLGLATGRDSWAYNFSAADLRANVVRMIDNYNDEVARASIDGDHQVDRDPTRISWNRNLDADYAKRRRHDIDPGGWRISTYRPFCRQRSYFSKSMNAMQYQLARGFPTAAHENLGFVCSAPGAAAPFSVLALTTIPDLVVVGAGNPTQFFSRWTWERLDEGTLEFGDAYNVLDGYRRIDNITDQALRRWQTAYGQDWTKDDVFFYCYGLLHSHDYRETYAADLKKTLPRIPLVASAADARSFADAGRRLFDLHVNYESVPVFPLDGLDATPAEPGAEAAHRFYAVGDKKMRFGKPTDAQKAAGEKYDRSVIHYNENITLGGIPEEAYRYQLGARSAIEWIIDRYYVKTDKASGIVNDPNDWSREVGDPRYILDLLARVVTVSVETMRIVEALPALVVDADLSADVGDSCHSSSESEGGEDGKG